MRKQLFSCLLHFIVLSASGQAIQLQNQTYDQDSDTIYIGVENAFKMSGALGDLIRIDCDEAAIKWNGSSLSIAPRYPGTVKIVFTMTTGKTESVFTAVYLPNVRAVFEDTNGKELSILKMADLPRLKGLVVKCNKDNFVNDVEILSFVVSSNGRSYEFQGASFGDADKKLLNLRPDDILLLEKVNLINKRTGQKMITYYNGDRKI